MAVVVGAGPRRIVEETLYDGENDTILAAERIEDVISDEFWRDPKYQAKARVT